MSTHQKTRRECQADAIDIRHRLHGLADALRDNGDDTSADLAEEAADTVDVLLAQIPLGP